MRTLYQFPLSPFCEKARWLLDYKELSFVAKNQTPLLHRGHSYYVSQQYKLPILKDGNAYIADSSHIALYLEQRYPEYPLFYDERLHRDDGYGDQSSNLNQQIRHLDHRSQQLGQLIKYWLYDHMALPAHSLGERGILRRFECLSLPLLQSSLRLYSKQQTTQAATLEQQLICHFDQLRCMIQKSNSGYLVGHRLTLADIAICSMLAPIVMPYETPWSDLEAINTASAIYRCLDEDVLGDYVRRIYQDHRHARVDWRGV